MIEVKAPHVYLQYKDKFSVFLAGSIEMGAVEDWQKKVAEAWESLDILALNPRRNDWDSSWTQSIDNPQFCAQVEWELDALDYADIIVLYFCPNTKSPISLLELGIHAASNPEKLVVCCPTGFWRKGNVDIVCARYGVQQVTSLEEIASVVVSKIK